MADTNAFESPDSDERYRHPQRPPLTEAQRREREGNVTLPMTDAVRTILAPLDWQSALVPYIWSATVVFLAVILLLLVVLNINSPAAVIVPFFLAIVGYFPFARWMRVRQVARAKQIPSYERYTGRLAIAEHGTHINQAGTLWDYQLQLPAPPALTASLRFSFEGKKRHQEVCSLTWGVVEYVGNQVISVRDERGLVLYQHVGLL